VTGARRGVGIGSGGSFSRGRHPSLSLNHASSHRSIRDWEAEGVVCAQERHRHLARSMARRGEMWETARRLKNWGVNGLQIGVEKECATDCEM